MRLLKAIVSTAALAGLMTAGVAQADATRSGNALPGVTKAKNGVVRASEQARESGESSDLAGVVALPLLLGSVIVAGTGLLLVADEISNNDSPG
jgi:hypothetical protein